MTALLVGKSTIKIDEVTTTILQNEVLRRENPASNSGGGSSALVVSGGVGGIDGVTGDCDEGGPSPRGT